MEKRHQKYGIRREDEVRLKVPQDCECLPAKTFSVAPTTAPSPPSSLPARYVHVEHERATAPSIMHINSVVSDVLPSCVFLLHTCGAEVSMTIAPLSAEKFPDLPGWEQGRGWATEARGKHSSGGKYDASSSYISRYRMIHMLRSYSNGCSLGSQGEKLRRQILYVKFLPGT